MPEQTKDKAQEERLLEYRAELPKANQPAGDSTKEADHTKCGYYDESYVYVPWGVTSLADYEAAQEMEEAGKEARKLTSAFSQIAQNILRSMDISNKAQALSRLASEFTSKLSSTIRGKEAPMPEQDTKALSSPSPSHSQPEDSAIPIPAGSEVANSLLIWKEGGVYKWVAAYSNNYRDEDNPPEIISTQSHKEFDEALGKGEYPMPEAWLWHIPFPVGQAQIHAFDEETGFTLSAGEFYKGMDWAAEGVIKAEWDEVSHGMPTSEIERDEKDQTIITRHRTREISFLPKGKAANKLAFSVISKETDDMAIPSHKRDEFVKTFGADKVAEIEKALEGKATEAKEAGLEQKEQGQEPAPTAESQPATPQPDLTLEALAQTIAGAIKPLVEANQALTEEVKGLNDRVKELEKDDATKIAEKAAATPAASLEAMLLDQLGGGLFSKATQIAANAKLGNSKPKEAQATTQKSGLFFDSWVGPAQQ